MNLLFSVFGLIGGLLCCAGDILFDLKGSGNQKLGTSKNIDSNWLNMAEWRFGASILCAMFGVVGVGFGFYSIVDQIYAEHVVLASVMAVTGYIGMTGGLFIHALLCLQAVIYKRIMSGGKQNFALADHTLEGYYKAVILPFFFLCVMLMIADLCVIIAVLVGALPVPKWMALLNSVVFLAIGLVFRKIDPEKFQDLPGIIMPSLGLAMVGVIGIAALI